ncbi:MAG: LPS export ABC transporter periplasmic protein LptC [Alphaproteobacteria bacterium]
MTKKLAPFKPGWRDRSGERKKLQRGSSTQGILKIVFPCVALGIFIGIFVWPNVMKSEYQPKHEDVKEMFARDPKLKNTVLNPVFDSLDEKGRPVSITSKRAIQHDKDHTALFEPVGTIYMQDGTKVNFTAMTGMYHHDQQKLFLQTDVHLNLDTGYDLYSTSAQIDIAHNQAEGFEPVHGTGPSQEQLQAEGFKLIERGDQVDFKGRSTVQLPSQGGQN